MAGLAVLFLVTSIGSVYAAGYAVSQPLLGTTGAPALAPGTTGAPPLFSGAISVLYADGRPVTLSSNKVTLLLCASSCINVDAILTQTAPGIYTYSFPPASLSGTLTIYVPAGNLADDNGKIFPSVNTQIGAYATPAPGMPSQTIPTNQAQPQALPSAPMQPSGLTHEAVTQETPTQSSSPILAVAVALSVLFLASFGLLILPPRLN